MARRYTRDNRGRFASGGGGATARGGRLRTAAGNKRATQTMKAAGGQPKNTLAKRQKVVPTTAKDRAQVAEVKRRKSGKLSAEDRMVDQAMKAAYPGVPAPGGRAIAGRSAAKPAAPKASGRTRAQAAAAQAKRREGVAQRVQQRENSENQSYAGYNGRRQQQGLKTVSMERIKKGKSTGDTQLGLMGGGSAIKSPARFAGATVRTWSSGARIKGAVKPAAKPAQAKAAPTATPTKAERITARVAANMTRAQSPARSAKAERKQSRTYAVASFAMSHLSSRAVGKNDPSKQYPRDQLMSGLNKAIRKPLPKAAKKSTARTKNDQTRSLRDLQAGLYARARRKAK